LVDQQLTLDYASHAWLPRSGEQLSHPWVLETLSKEIWQSEDDVLETILDIPIVRVF
jgi:hypothetical protein